MLSAVIWFRGVSNRSDVPFLYPTTDQKKKNPVYKFFLCMQIEGRIKMNKKKGGEIEVIRAPLNLQIKGRIQRNSFHGSD